MSFYDTALPSFTTVASCAQVSQIGKIVIKHVMIEEECPRDQTTCDCLAFNNRSFGVSTALSYHNANCETLSLFDGSEWV